MAYTYGATTYGTIVGISAEKYEVRVGYEAQNYNIENNTTPVNAILQVRTIDSNYGTWGIQQTSTLGDIKFSAKTFSVREKNTWVTFASATLTITHNSDGTYRGTLEGSFTTNGSETYSLKSGSASVDMVLPTIPRATTPRINITSLTMGESAKIALNPADSSFKHKLTYSFRGVANLTSGLSIGDGFSASGATTVSFIPPVSLADSIPNDNSGLLSIYCTTYDANGNQVGTRKTISITANVPDYTPTLSVSVVGKNLCNAEYAEGKSYSVVTITASGKYGSTIQSYSTAVDGKTYTGPSFTTSELSRGTKTFVINVKDSRGKEGTNKSNTVNVYTYTSPSITSFTASRGTDETTVTTRLVGSVSPVNGKNTSSLTITLNGETKTVTSGEIVTFTDLSTDETYEAIARVTDAYATTSRNISISTVYVTLDFNASGKGIAVGKVSEKDAFEVNMNADFLKGVSIKDLKASWEELSYSKGLTSNVQDQLDNKAPKEHTHDEYGKLAIATETTLGAVMIGDNLTIDKNGKLDAIVPKIENEFTTEEKNKLAGIEENAQKNQNAFGKVTTGGGAILSAKTPQNLLWFEDGENITIDVDPNEYKLTFNATIPKASYDNFGTIKIHSQVHKEGAPTHYKIVADNDEVFNIPTLVIDGALRYIPNDFILDATESADGLMSSEDKTKLNGIEGGAEKNIVTGVGVFGGDPATAYGVKIQTTNNSFNVAKIDQNDRIRSSVLPVATTTSLGAVIIDETTLSIDKNGKVSATSQIPSRITETEIDSLFK